MRLSNWANVLTASRAQLERLVEEEVWQTVTYNTMCWITLLAVTLLCDMIIPLYVVMVSLWWHAKIPGDIQRSVLHDCALHGRRVQSYDRTAGSYSAADHSFNCGQTGLHTNNGHYIACARRITDHWHTSGFQWIESGCQAGGNYKCSFCRVPTSSYIDSVNCYQIPHKSLSDSQAHVVAGIRGRKRHSMKPFKSLSTRRAGRIDSTGKGETCGEWLVHHLGGLQRVPLLLVSNPSAEIKALHLEHYAINNFEPLDGCH